MSSEREPVKILPFMRRIIPMYGKTPRVVCNQPNPFRSRTRVILDSSGSAKDYPLKLLALTQDGYLVVCMDQFGRVRSSTLNKKPVNALDAVIKWVDAAYSRNHLVNPDVRHLPF